MGNYHVAFAALLLLLTCSAPPVWAEPQCPQPRFTGVAPADYLARVNPQPVSRKALRSARALYRGKAEASVNCAHCHGKKGDGLGPLSAQFDPPPRNFRCAETVNGIADGQLFWIIRFGSPGTAMPAHPQPSDDDIWSLVTYLRHLAAD